MNNATETTISESALRKRAQRRGYSMHRARGQMHCNNLGEFMLVEIYNNTVAAGSNYDMTLDEISEFLDDLDKE